MDVVSVSGDRIVLEDDGERYTVTARDVDVDPGTTGD